MGDVEYECPNNHDNLRKNAWCPASRETVSKLHIHAPVASTAPALSSTDPVRAVDSASASISKQVLDVVAGLENLNALQVD